MELSDSENNVQQNMSIDDDDNTSIAETIVDSGVDNTADSIDSTRISVEEETRSRMSTADSASATDSDSASATDITSNDPREALVRKAIAPVKNDSRTVEAPYGYRADGLPRLRSGRKPLYSAEEKRQRTNEYHRKYYQKRKLLQQQQKALADSARVSRDEPPVLRQFSSSLQRYAAENTCFPLKVQASDPNVVQVFELCNPKDLVAYLDLCLQCLVDAGSLTGYQLSSGQGTADTIHPRHSEKVAPVMRPTAWQRYR